MLNQYRSIRNHYKYIVDEKNAYCEFACKQEGSEEKHFNKFFMKWILEELTISY